MLATNTLMTISGVVRTTGLSEGYIRSLDHVLKPERDTANRRIYRPDVIAEFMSKRGTK